ncbi:PH domain-containing protein [Candidatus Bathyarchaeota archaeon]|nr:PH domain-containing protein [Candidatus Bathyarchaeota archaeon]
MSQLDRYLRFDKKVQWSGRPEKRALQIRGLMFLPIALLFLVFPIMMMNITSSSGFSGFALLFNFIPVAFFLIFFGSIIFQFFSYGNIQYMVTNQRIIIRQGVLGSNTRFIDLALIQEISVNIGYFDRFFGTGTITFRTAGVGFDGGSPSSFMFGSSFMALKNPYEVEALIGALLRERGISKV